MQILQSFNPADYQGQIAEKFSVCPSIFNLFSLSNTEGDSEISCSIPKMSVPKVLFVPEQTQQGLPSCHENTGMQYLFTKVASKRGIEPDFWLITCSFSLCGYLLPIEVFQEGKVIISPPELVCSDMFA